MLVLVQVAPLLHRSHPPPPPPSLLPYAVSMYLNSGPGGLAGIFVHQRLAEEGFPLALVPCAASPPAQHCPALQAGGATTRKPGVT